MEAKDTEEEMEEEERTCRDAKEEFEKAYLQIVEPQDLAKSGVVLLRKIFGQGSHRS